MSASDRLARLAAIAAMKRDADLARLGRAAAERDALRARLDALAASASAPPPADPALFAVRQRHLQWAEAQRHALNTQLAATTATWLACREDAARSYGRAAVIDALKARRTTRRGERDER